jgi:hypothetical protein
MTPKKLNTIIQKYQDTLKDPFLEQTHYFAALEEVKAAYALYESVPTAVYSLGTFEVKSAELIITDAYVGNQHAISVKPAVNGIWHAFVLANKGIHVALFAYHNEVISQHLDKIIELTNQVSWTKIGMVPIDTATCTIADRDGYEPLDVEQAGYKIAGISAHQCFSDTANADGSYPIYIDSKVSLVRGVYVDFSLAE